jgi:hypothetical protein
MQVCMQALFEENIYMDYLCVLLTCLTQSHAHEFFKAADAQKEVNVSLYSHAV